MVYRVSAIPIKIKKQVILWIWQTDSKVCMEMQKTLNNQHNTEEQSYRMDTTWLPWFCLITDLKDQGCITWTPSFSQLCPIVLFNSTYLLSFSQNKNKTKQTQKQKPYSSTVKRQILPESHPLIQLFQLSLFTTNVGVLHNSSLQYSPIP